MRGDTFSVVIPTYQRPVWIQRAIRSLARQSRLPDEVIPVARDTDTPTHAAIDQLVCESLPFPVRRALVSDPGFMPPVHAGFRQAAGTVIAIMDDDAEAVETWAERLLSHYVDPRVGAVGGRVINMLGEGEREDVGTTKRVGYLSPFGKIVGEMYKEPVFAGPVDVSFLMGGNMSFRADVARRMEFDWALNRVVATHYEIDLGLQVRQMGYRIVFDPAAAIRHYTAPRAVTGNRRTGDAEAIRWNVYNETRVVIRRLPPWRAAIIVARGLLLGTRRGPGILPWVFAPLARRLGFVTEVAPAAIAGRIGGVRSVMTNRRDHHPSS